MIIATILLACCLTPSPARNLCQVRPLPTDEARALIEEVEAAAERAGSALNIVRIRARAANLIWQIDPADGRLRFTRLRAWAVANIEKTAELEQAQLEILQQLYPRDPSLADEWVADELVKASGSPPPPSPTLTDRLNGLSGKIRLNTNLALRTMETDSRLAARLLGEAFTEGYNYPAHAALIRLTEIEPLAGETVASVILGQLSRQASRPNAQSVMAAQMLFEYFFSNGSNGSNGQNSQSPGGPGNISAPGVRPGPGSTLRNQYFTIASTILAASLTHRDLSPKSSAETRLLEVNQALLATRLNSIAGSIPEIDKRLLDDLKNSARQLRSAIPPELSGVPATLESGTSPQPLSPEEQAAGALRTGDIPTARRAASLIRNESSRSFVNRAISLLTVRSMIERRDLAEALTFTLGVEDVSTRLHLLGQLVKMVQSEKERHFTRYIIDLIVRQAGDWTPSATKSELLLSLARLDGSLRLLDTAIESINALNPADDRLLTTNSFRLAFLDNARLDNAAILVKIADIRSVAFELMARLALSEALLNPQPEN